MIKGLKLMTVIPFQVHHGFEIELRDEDREFKTEEQFRKWLSVLHNAGNCYSLAYEGDIIFCGGICILYPGIGEGWLLCSKRIIKFVRELYYYTDFIIQSIINKYTLHRVQAYVKASWKDAVHFLEKLGFQREGLLKKFISEKDYYIYARVL